LAVAESLKENVDAEIIWIGSKKGIENQLISDYKFYAITTGKLRRYFSWQNFFDFFKTIKGIFEAAKILKKEKPDLVFAKGGYVSVPVAIAAWRRKIPVIIHESDSTPGLATKIISRFAKKICVSFEKNLKEFSEEKVIFTGNPIRKEILEGDSEKGLNFTKLNKKKAIILIMGGSTGAMTINKVIQEALPEILKVCQIIHITGAGKEIEVDKKNELIKNNYRQYSFIDEELKDIYAITDLIITRASANVLSEIAAVGKAAIIIPHQYSPSKHQLKNAQEFENKNAGILLEEKDLSGEKLIETVKNLLEDKEKLRELEKNIKKTGNTKAAEKLVEVILGFLDKGK